eukprot:1121779-Prymnesium_polylepis.1
MAPLVRPLERDAPVGRVVGQHLGGLGGGALAAQRVVRRAAVPAAHQVDPLDADRRRRVRPRARRVDAAHELGRRLRREAERRARRARRPRAADIPRGAAAHPRAQAAARVKPDVR